MNQIDELHQIEAIVDAKYQQQQQSFQRLVGEENRLRSEIAKLDANFKKARDGDVQFGMTTIGADIMWQAWVGKRKAELNTKLAQVLAIKEHHLKQVQKAFGKVVVARELLADTKKSVKTKTAQNDLLRAIQMTIE